MVRRRRFKPGIVATAVRQFEQIGYRIRHGGVPNSISDISYPRLGDRRFRQKFGCSSTVCANGWLLIMDGWRNKPRGVTKERWLWALHLLKSYDTEGNLSARVGEGCDEKTFRKWAWYLLEELSEKHAEIVSSHRHQKCCCKFPDHDPIRMDVRHHRKRSRHFPFSLDVQDMLGE